MENRIETKDAENEVSQKNDGLNLNSISKCSNQDSPVYKCDTNSSALNLPNVEIGGLSSKPDSDNKQNGKEDLGLVFKDQSRCPAENDDEGEGGGGYKSEKQTSGGGKKSDENMSGMDDSGKVSKGHKADSGEDTKTHKDQKPDSSMDEKETSARGLKEDKEQLGNSAKNRKDSYDDSKGGNEHRVGRNEKMGPDLHVEPEQWQRKEYSKKGNG